MMKGVRADLVIATLALAMSTTASLSSLYQTKVIANQLSSSVWPYLSINTSTTTGSAFALSVTNNGLGPALVRSASLELDGRTLSRYRDGLATLVRGIPAKNAHASASYSSIGSTTVIRPGEKFVTLSYAGKAVGSFSDLGQRYRLTLCYCSLLGQCWTVRGQDEPAAVASCSRRSSIDY
jgi:hypothetical protein